MEKPPYYKKNHRSVEITNGESLFIAEALRFYCEYDNIIDVDAENLGVNRKVAELIIPKFKLNND